MSGYFNTVLFPKNQLGHLRARIIHAKELYEGGNLTHDEYRKILLALKDEFQQIQQHRST